MKTPEESKKERELTKSLRNEAKDLLPPKRCTQCSKAFRPVSQFSLFCGLCKAGQRRQA